MVASFFVAIVYFTVINSSHSFIDCSSRKMGDGIMTLVPIMPLHSAPHSLAWPLKGLDCAA